MLDKIKELREKFYKHTDELKKTGFKNYIVKYKSIIQEHVLEIKEKLSNLEKTNYDLALYHFNSGNNNDAIMRFNIVRIIWKNKDPKIDYYMGRIYTINQKYSRAKIYLDHYIRSGDQTFFQEAEFSNIIAYHLSKREPDSIDQINKKITSIPQKIIQLRYQQNSNLNKNSKAIENILDIKISIVNILSKINPYTKNPHNNNIIEIGCGSGIIGSILRKKMIFNLLVGFDYCQNDILLAHNKNLGNIYNELIFINDIFKDISNNLSKYSIAIIYEIINYINDIKFIINNFAHCEILIICFRGDSTIQKEDIFKFNAYREDFTFSPLGVQEIFETHGWYLIQNIDNGSVLSSANDKRHYYTMAFVKDIALVEKKDIIFDEKIETEI
ncbi:hypothetical protein [Lyticum sinuosum]|uniref:SAM-dependent methyltransferase n=1 Tax=Lyticum sinuosum TaxID=1332059 RepID=A0AAE4VK89_9RICK|nr:hypothetical protein [Lyticum sinuosum]MDZ5761496.1 SAM-dependent methyltransferase [Lyticum sinuosum]